MAACTVEAVSVILPLPLTFTLTLTPNLVPARYYLLRRLTLTLTLSAPSLSTLALTSDYRYYYLRRLALTLTVAPTHAHSHL